MRLSSNRTRSLSSPGSAKAACKDSSSDEDEKTSSDDNSGEGDKKSDEDDCKPAADPLAGFQLLQALRDKDRTVAIRA